MQQEQEHVAFVFLKTLFIIFTEREREGEREVERHQCVVTSPAPPTGDLTRNTGMCPDWDSNWQPFGSQTSTQSTEPHQPGQDHIAFKKNTQYCKN